MGSFDDHPCTELLRYAARMSVGEHEVLDQIRNYTFEKIPHNPMMAAKEELYLIANILKSIGAKKALDIGVFTGSSSLMIAEALPEDGKVIACDISEEHTTTAAKTFWKKAGLDHKIDLRIAPALDTLNSLLEAGEGETFDFAFIDADKKNYDAYYELCLKLVRQNGIIAIDNTLWSGAVLNESDTSDINLSMRAINEKLQKDTRVKVNLLVLGDGTSLVFKQ